MSSQLDKTIRRSRSRVSVYTITGRAYRGHQQGALVEMVLDDMAEARAIRRGDIQLVERSTPSLVEGSYRLPRTAPDGAERGADAHQDPDQGRRPNSA